MRAAVALLALLLSACASAPAVVQGGGDSIALTQALAAHERPRIAVGAILDKTEGAIEKAFYISNAALPADAQVTPSALTRGIRDMLTTGLFGSSRFIVIERDALPDVLAEQEFSQSARVGDATRLPLGQLEGADFIAIGAITSFGSDRGGSLPIEIGGSKNLFGLLNLGASRSAIVLDLRVIEVKTGRVVSSSAVEGKSWKFGVDVAGVAAVGGRGVRLPGLLRGFSNTPIEKALLEMTRLCVERIAGPSAK